MSDSTTAATPPKGQHEKSRSGLRGNYLNFAEVLGQSIATIAPTATLALVIPLVFATAGNGTWLVYLFGTIAIIFVAASVNVFTKHSASPGSLYAFAARGFGPGAGVITGWALLLAYVLTGSAVACGFANYADVLLKYGHLALPGALLVAIGVLSAWYVSYRDIKLSANLMLGLEFVSIALVLAVAVASLVHNGFKLDFNQLRLVKVNPDSIRIGLVLAFFSFVGFEAAGTLGEEAQNPLKTIPRALTASAASVGILFIFLSFVEVAGFAGSATPLNASAAPLTDLAGFAGIGWLGPLISLGALVSFWACTLGCINAGSRILFSLGRHGVFHSSVGATHETHDTPHVAVTVTALAVAIAPVILLIAKSGGFFDIYGWVGTIATFGFLFVYLVVALAAPFYLRKRGELKVGNILLAAATVAILAIPIVGSVFPLPAGVYAYFPFTFLGWLVLGIAWYAYRRSNSTVIGDIADDLNKVSEHFRDALPEPS
jgi:amino acid transporter